MIKFEDVLVQYEPMISATLRKLNIYRDHEIFRQVACVALWQAWERYDEDKGHFAPYASSSIRGAMLDNLKREHRFEVHVIQTEDDMLASYMESSRVNDRPTVWSEELAVQLEQLAQHEQQLLQWLFIEGYTQKECAEKANISVAGIKKRRERLIAKLRKELKLG